MCFRTRDAARIALFAGIYAATGILGLRLDPVSDFASLVWAPTGLSIAVLLLLGQRSWPGITLGALAVSFSIGASLPVALGIAAGHRGSVRAEAPPGGGSAFVVELPLER